MTQQELSTMTLQQAFVKMYLEVIRQGRPSRDKLATNRMEHEGTRCAIGHLLPSSICEKDFSLASGIKYVLENIKHPFTPQSPAIVLERVAVAHDIAPNNERFISGFKSMVTVIAQDHSLELPEDDVVFSTTPVDVIVRQFGPDAGLRECAGEREDQRDAAHALHPAHA